MASHTTARPRPALQIVGQQWQGVGVLGAFCAPREMVLLRTWRKDTDGTFIVIYQSTKHRSMREAKGGGWKAPVRVNVQAAGYTVAPLMQVRCGGSNCRALAAFAPCCAGFLCASCLVGFLGCILQKYTQGPGAESSESLITLVLKADLGGFLSGECGGGSWECRPACHTVPMGYAASHNNSACPAPECQAQQGTPPCLTVLAAPPAPTQTRALLGAYWGPFHPLGCGP